MDRGGLIRFCKWVIAVLVAAGLLMAARSAVTQWTLETQKVRGEIARLESQISRTESPDVRAQLRSSQATLDAAMPRLANLRWSAIGLAGMVYALALCPPAMVLRRALLSLGEEPRVGTAVAAQMIGHVGKYVPGKAMVVVLRVGALSRDRIGALPATLSVFLETFLMMAVGAALGGLVTFWLPVPRWIAGSAVAVAVLAGLPTLPPILRRIAGRVTRTSLTHVHNQIGARLFVAAWGWSILSWLLIGVSFTLLVFAIPAVQPLPPLSQLYPIATAAVSLAMVAGFASLLPGGAGVRELVLTTILSVSIGTAHGLLAAIAARLVFMAVESVVAGIAWWWLRQQSPEPATSTG